MNLQVRMQQVPCYQCHTSLGHAIYYTFYETLESTVLISNEQLAILIWKNANNKILLLHLFRIFNGTTFDF